MNRLNEIAARLAAIATEIDTATGDALVALEQEVTALSEERASIEAENTRRQQLRQQVAAGSIGVPAPAAPAPTATPEQLEERAFVGFLRGTVAEMRTNEQNFTLANNSNLVPVTIARRIIDRVTELCPILQGATVYRFGGKLQIPVYGPKAVSGTNHDVTAGYAADFVELTADAGAFTSVDLTGYLVGALSLIGKTLVNNSAIDVVSFVVNKVAEKISAFVEGELLAGTGHSNNHCAGALSTTNNLNAESVSAITADKLIELQAKVPRVYQANACWTMNPATWTAVKELKDAENRYLVNPDFTQEFPYRLLGKPVYLSDAMPVIASAAKAVLYGDYSGLAVKISEEVSVEVLREKYATQHALGVVGYMEIDSSVENSQKLATLTMSVTA